MNLRPPGYEPDELPAALLRDIIFFSFMVCKWRRKQDLNPRAFDRLSVFKTDPFSRTWVFLRKMKTGGPGRTRTYDRPVMSR